MGKIGIIGAMDSEVNTLKNITKINKTTSIADMVFCEGLLNDKEVVIVQCGIGKVNAGICAHTLINIFHCTKIINTGVAGSLDKRLNIGDIVVSVDAVQHDFDIVALGHQKGEIPYTGLYAFEADKHMREVALHTINDLNLDVKAYEGRICSGDQFITSNEQKRIIVNDFKGMCCEMEGAAIAQVCYLNKTPFLIIRAISDKTDGSVPKEFFTFKIKSSEISAKIVASLINNL